MEALIIAAALLTADAEVRQSEAFACWCEVSRFPDTTALQEAAYAHKDWLTACQVVAPDLNPNIGELLCEQELAMEAYRLLGIVRARPYVPGDWDKLRELRDLIGDDAYFTGRLPAPVTCQRRAAP